MRATPLDADARGPAGMRRRRTLDGTPPRRDAATVPVLLARHAARALVRAHPAPAGRAFGGRRTDDVGARRRHVHEDQGEREGDAGSHGRDRSMVIRAPKGLFLCGAS